MKKDSNVFLLHILESIELIEKYIKDKNKEDFNKSVQLQDSVIRRIEIIGEATKALPQDIKKQYPDVPWKQISGMRDILIHKYSGVDLDLTWQTIIKDIPELKKKVKRILEELQ